MRILRLPRGIGACGMHFSERPSLRGRRPQDMAASQQLERGRRLTDEEAIAYALAELLEPTVGQKPAGHIDSSRHGLRFHYSVISDAFRSHKLSRAQVGLYGWLAFGRSTAHPVFGFFLVRYRTRYRTRYLESMPALNVEFSEEEMARLRDRAALTGRSLKQHVHDVTVEEADRLAFVEGAVAEAARVLPGIEARFPAGQR
ncbi:hypothetical protein ACFU9Y_01000 [Streptomyces sp. NPDC057621]